MHKLQHRYENQIKQTVSVCHKLSADKYVTSHGGNVSWAVDRHKSGKSNILITPTTKFKGDLTFDDICITDYDGNVLYAPEGGKPTGELPFHLLFYHERPDIASVVHGHPPHATAFSMVRGINYLSWPLLPEPTTEVGPVCMVPYAEPITQELANKFMPYIDKFNAFLMENHGLTVISKFELERTSHFIDIIELTAQKISAALKMGKIKAIPRGEVENLEKTMKTRFLPLPGKPGVWKKLTDCYNFKEISENGG